MKKFLHSSNFRNRFKLKMSFFLVFTLFLNIGNVFGQATPCTNPIIYFLKTEGTSTDAALDGKIKLYGDVTGTNKVVVSTSALAAPTNNTEFTNAPLFSSFTNGYIKTNAPNTNQTYYVRVYSTDGLCYTDNTVNFEKTNFTTIPTQPDIMIAVSHNGGAFVAKNTAFSAVVTVQNDGTATATGLEVTVTIPAGLTVGTPTASVGTYNATTGKWTIPSIAPGSVNNATLTFANTTSTTEGVKFISANLTAETQTDKDSSPTTNNAGEDDQDVACVSTPYELCNGNKIDITLTSYTGIIWQKDGVTITGSVPGQYTVNANGSLTIYAIGEYTYSITSGPNACPTGGCCPIKVIAAPLPVLSLTSTPVSCFGGNDGTITATATSGTTPYEFSRNGTTFQLSGAFTSLTAGTYTITAKDFQGCTATATTTVTQPVAGLSVAAPVVVNASCFGTATGSVTLTASGGTSPYQYKQGTGSFVSTNAFTGLAAGTYSFTVQDSKGCSVTTSATVTQPVAALSVAAPVVVNASCFGTATGSVTLTASGGTSPYQYQQGTGSFVSTNAFTGLAAGTYSFTVKDANGCSVTTSATVTQPVAALSVAAPVVVNASCFGTATGSVTLTASGGTSPYQYKQGTGSFVSTNAFTGLAAGTYSFTVQDSKGCSVTTSATVTQPVAALSVAAPVVVNASCFGTATGSVTLTASGGTSPYQYQQGTGSFVSTNAFTGLAAGTYSFTVKDANGCSVTTSATVTQPVAALSVAAPVVVNASCFGTATGSVTLTASGGTSPYQYKQGTGSFVSTNAFTGLAAGTYSFTVKDANGCTTTTSATVTQPVAALSVAAPVVVNASCFGTATGSVTLTASGGTSPYQYKQGTGSFVSTNAFTGLAAGTYSFTVQDSKGCSVTTSATVTQPVAALSVAAPVVVNASCFGTATGSVTLTASGGTSPYQYQQGTGSFVSTNAFTGLAAGTYSFTVQDSKGCSVTTSATVTQPVAALSVAAPVVVNASCFGTATGSVTLTASGGTSPYQYQQGTGSFVSTNAFTGLAAGTYSFTVKDANGCSVTTSATVTQPVAALSVAAPVVVNASCFGTATGSVTLTASGGTSPYQYQQGTGSFVSTNAFTGLAAGTYSFTVKDANGCSVTTSATVTQPVAALSVAAPVVVNASCFGTATGSVTLTASGGTSPYQYQQGTGSFVSTNAFTGLAAGTYSFTVKDANGCSVTTSATVTQPAAALSVAAPVVVNASCFGTATGSVTLTASGGTSPYQYQQGTGSFVSTNAFTGLAAGTYSFTVKDANGCSVTTSATVTQPVAALSVAAPVVVNASCFGTATGSVTLTASGGTSPYQYQQGTGSFVSTNAFTGLAAGTYSFTVKDANGCSVTTSATVTQPVAALSVAAPVVVNASCFGTATGSVTLTASGGTSPYQYQQGTGSFVSTNAFTGLAAGTYSFTVKDANGCSVTTSATVTQPVAALSVNVPVVTPICQGQSATFTATASGGTSPYTYTWSNSLPNGSTQTVTPSTTTTYTVIATDSKSCSATTTVIVTVNPLPTASLATSAPCAGTTTVLAPTGLSNAATFLWSTGATSSNISVNPTVPTGYSLTVTSSSNPACSITRTVWLDVKPLPTAEVTVIPSMCLGSVAQSNGQLMLNKYRDSDQVAYGSPISATPTFANIPSGGIFASGLANTVATYTIRLKNTVTNCINDLTAVMSVTVCPCPAGYCEPATVVKTK